MRKVLGTICLVALMLGMVCATLLTALVFTQEGVWYAPFLAGVLILVIIGTYGYHIYRLWRTR